MAQEVCESSAVRSLKSATKGHCGICIIPSGVELGSLLEDPVQLVVIDLIEIITHLCVRWWRIGNTKSVSSRQYHLVSRQYTVNSCNWEW